MNEFLAAAKGKRERLVAWRRDFHRHPELGYAEERTAGIVAAHLEGVGYRVQTGVGRGGGVGRGARSGVTARRGGRGSSRPTWRGWAIGCRPASAGQG